MENKQETEKQIEQAFDSFCNKDLNELTAKEEDFLLEQAREENGCKVGVPYDEIKDGTEIDEEYEPNIRCRACNSIGKGVSSKFNDEGAITELFKCECGHEEIL